MSETEDLKFDEWRDLKYSAVKAVVENGDKDSKTILAWLKLLGLGGAVDDEVDPIELLEQRVKEDDSDAMWILGICCETGRDIDQDVKRAESLYEQSNSLGNKVGNIFRSNIICDRRKGKIKIQRENLSVLGRVLPFTSWLDLDLKMEKIGNDGTKNLCKCLMSNSTVSNLELAQNEIGAEGGDAIGELLSNNMTLTELGLFGNEIGTGKISQSLMVNTSLTKLKLDRNSIGDEGAISLSSALLINTTLVELDLRWAHIGVEGAKKLGEALVVNYSLTTLHLDWNGIEDEGAKSISESLKRNTTLTLLNICGNNIKDAGAKDLSESIKVNSTLTVLNLGYNYIGEEGIKALNESLVVNTTLTQLDLPGNNVAV